MPGMNTGLEGTKRRHDTAIFEPKVLPNNITLWLQDASLLKNRDEGIVLAFLPKIGSRCDPEYAKGAAHFLEHGPFSEGTLGRPSVQEFASPVERLGGYVYSGTKMEMSRYFVRRMPRNGFDVAAETVYEMIARRRNTKDFVLRERGAIAQEARKIYTGEDPGTVPYYVFHHLYQNLFREHPLDHVPRGNPDHVEAMTPEILMDFWKTYYHAGNIQLVCGGNFAKRADALEKISSVFGKIRKGKPVDICHGQPFLRKKSNRVCVNVPKAASDSLTIVYPMPADATYGTREMALEFLANVIGGWGYTSPLFVELRLRPERANIYSQSCFAEYFTGARLFWFHVGIDSADFEFARDAFIRVLKELNGDFVIRRQKERQMQRKLLTSNPADDCIAVTEDLTDYGRCISWHEREALEDEITVDQVLAWRNQLLAMEPFVLEIKSGS